MSSAAPSLDHLRIFAEIVDVGSFSGAARRLQRSQPAVSYAVATIEGQLGFALFERGKRKPVLTQGGTAVLAYARRIAQLADELMASAASVTRGLEGSIVCAIDGFFPREPLALALAESAERYPSVAMDIRIVPREQALKLVTDSQAAFAVAAIDVAWPPGIEARDFGSVEIVAVAAPGHALASLEDRIPTMVLRDNVQITNRSAGGGGEALDVSINSSRIWRVNDAATQLMLLRAGVGWSYLPSDVAEREIGAGRLVQLHPATRARGVQPWSLVFRASQRPGPASRFLSERLEWHVTHQEI